MGTSPLSDLFSCFLGEGNVYDWFRSYSSVKVCVYVILCGLPECVLAAGAERPRVARFGAKSLDE